MDMNRSEHLEIRPLVSVIIPCYNQGQYLAEAIRSALRQRWTSIEIIVVDDGSTDHTRSVALSFPDVRYYYQPNAGLAAARNNGIAHCRGLYLVFLDADDILYPDAVEVNVQWLMQHPECAFVSGGHDKVDEWLSPLPEQEETEPVSADHYLALLRGNYIGMHAAVMYRADVLLEWQFDETLSACEDYDLYLRIARARAVGCHGHKMAAYRKHGSNMSSRHAWMLRQVLFVLKRQRTALRSAEERAAWRDGIAIWRRYYAGELLRKIVHDVKKDSRLPGMADCILLLRETPRAFARYLPRKFYHIGRAALKQMLPVALVDKLQRTRLYRGYVPPAGSIQPGDFARMSPFSSSFGFDRGGAIDRYYIEAFLAQHAHRVRGRVLEIGDNAYTLRYGGSKVLRSDVLHIDHGNTAATYIGDLTDVPQIPSGAFDCIILTQTLHLIYDFRRALQTCYRILKPGGCLLLTVPGISHIDKGEWRDYWLWSFTDASVRRLMHETFTDSTVDVKSYGNVFVAAAFLYGMGLPEFNPEYLRKHDPSYQVIISASAIKG